MKKDRKTLRDITTEFQTHCHEGESNARVKVKILDAYYEVADIKKIMAGNDTYFVIETEV